MFVLQNEFGNFLRWFVDVGVVLQHIDVSLYAHVFIKQFCVYQNQVGIVAAGCAVWLFVVCYVLTYAVL